MDNDRSTTREEALRRLFNRFNQLEAAARSKKGHPSNKDHVDHYTTQEMCWALAKDAVRDEMVNDGA